MSTTLLVGQTLPLSIEFLDQNGRPVPVTLDEAPIWGSSGVSDALDVASDGLSAVLHGELSGDDVITISLAIGGKRYTASLDITIEDPPAVLTSVVILAGVPA